MTNVALCKEVADWAEAAMGVRHPDIFFDMTDWLSAGDLEDGNGPIPIEQLKERSCGTAACVAGYVSLVRAPKGTRTTGSTLYLPDGEVTDCAAFATKELDITPGQRSALFYASERSVIARLRHLAEHPDATGDDLEDVVA